MKWIDCAMASAALGSTLFTVYLLETGPKIETGPASIGPAFRAVVVHVLGACDRVKEPTEAHFFITAEGEIHPTVRWGRREVLSSTVHPEVNKAAVVVALEGGKLNRGQRRAFRVLLARLEREYPGISKRRVPHSRLERTDCASRLGRRPVRSVRHDP